MDTVYVVPYNPDWPNAFQRAATELRALLGEDVLAIEHIGSTAVVDLAAKPIIDMILGVAEIAVATRFIPALEKSGWENRHHRANDGRVFFVRRHQGERSHHLHVLEYPSRAWTMHVKFRDRMRRDPAVQADYQALKEQLAVAFEHDTNGYTEAKSGFIRGVLEQEGFDPA